MYTVNFNGVNVILKPVLNDDVNKSFAKWTPGGEIQMSISNPELVEKFKVGQEFLINFGEIVNAQELMIESTTEVNKESF
jgi:hypothetical protein